MTQMKILKSIWHVRCVEIIVSFENFFISRCVNLVCVRYDVDDG